jgi:Tol biopolymer transport system component
MRRQIQAGIFMRSDLHAGGRPCAADPHHPWHTTPAAPAARRTLWRTACGLAALLFAGGAAAELTRVPLVNLGPQGDGASAAAALSADGRYVAFSSLASNLASGDSNGKEDVFLHDHQGGTTSRLSVHSSGAQGNGDSRAPAISAAGTRIVFSSRATNLVDGDLNGKEDIFLRDLASGQTSRVSIGASDAEANGDSLEPAISADGRYVAFHSNASNLVDGNGDGNGTWDVFVRDTVLNTTVRVSLDAAGVQGNGASYSPALSADGSYVAFYSWASNLVTGDSNNAPDVFRRHLASGAVERVSLTSAGGQAGGASYSPAISGDGQRIAFHSVAADLVGDDINNAPDVFVRDLAAATTRRVSQHSNGTGGNGSSQSAAISADGSQVAFRSYATNLVDGDTNGVLDVFVHNLGSGATSRVSLGDAGVQGNGDSDAPALSADGAVIAFDSLASNLVADDTNTVRDLFVRSGGVVRRASLGNFIAGQPNGLSAAPALSGDGRYVALSSAANNLVAGDTNGFSDIFLYDVQGQTTRRVSLGDQGNQGDGNSSAPTLADDGVRVAFASLAKNLIKNPSGTYYDANEVQDVFLHDLGEGGGTTLISVSALTPPWAANGASYDPALSADGAFVAFSSLASDLVAADGNGREDVFVRDLQAGQTYLISRSSSGVAGDYESQEPAISADGGWVAFSSYASNLVTGDTNNVQDIFLHQRGSGQTTRLSQSSMGEEGNGHSYLPAISADGRFVAFASDASNLVAGDTNGVTDIFVRDTQENTTVRVSVDSLGIPANDYSYSPAISPDGRYVAFESLASNLVAGDTDGRWDVFVHDRATGETRRLSTSAAGVQGNGHSYTPAIARYASALAFESRASNLIANDSNGVQDVFLSYLLPTTTRISGIAPEPSVVGASYRVDVQVSAASVTPTGSVTVTDGTVSCTATLAGGAGFCNLTATAPAVLALTASYAGGGSFAGSSGSASHTVTKAATTLAITAHSPDPSVQGNLVSVSFSLGVAAPGAGTPSGSVTVSDGVNQCVAVLPASGCSLALTTLGTRTLSASYGGDASFQGSSASALHQVNAPGGGDDLDGDGIPDAADPDADGNGLDDAWERYYNLGNLGSVDPYSDPDGDGLNHLDEYAWGTNPTRFDTDGDGLGDGAEVTGGTDPLDPDCDDDGLLDGWDTTPLTADINACFGDIVVIGGRTYLTGERISCRAASGIEITPPVVAQPGSTVGLVAPVTRITGIQVQRGARFRIVGQAPVN